MPYLLTIQRVHADLNAIFDRIDTYFDLDDAVRQFRPAINEWSINEILEHITLTNHFLMLTLRASRDTVLKRSKTVRYQTWKVIWIAF